MNLKKTKISVVMPVYNAEKYLKQAIESVLEQSFKDFEFIVIDDGSTDKSLDILRDYEIKDGRVKVYLNKQNLGVIDTLNYGVKLAQGEYIARMDADDISYPERFEKQLKYMQDESLVACGTWAEGIDISGNKTRDMEYPPITDKIRTFTLFHDPFIHPSVMFQKDVFEKVGGYKKTFRHIEDYELWTRIVFKYKTGNIPETLLKYRFHGNQMTKVNNLEMRTRGILVRILASYRFIFRF